MQIHYTVHSAVRSPYQVTATLADGTVVPATVDGFVTELVSADASMSHTLRFGPHEAAAAAALFTQGAAITVTFDITPAPAEKDA